MSLADPRQVERADPTPPAARPRQAEAETSPDVGNQAIQALAGRGLRAKLEVGGAGDPEEREADLLAEQVMAGRAAVHCACGSPNCASCGGGKIRRQADTGAGAASPAAASGFGNRSGRPLDSGVRAQFEPRFGMDFGAVRIHDDPGTHGIARGIGARAFAIGNDIGFAEGRHDPNSSAGRSLLAHELAHVALGHGGVRRGGEGPAAPAPAPPAAPAAEPAAEFDPCAVDVPALNNRQLLQHFQIADSYMVRLDTEKRKGEERYYDYRNLRNRVIDEREARANTGHAWLNADISAIPDTLYGLESEGIGLVVTVTIVPGSAVVEHKPAGGIIVTKEQFERMLEREDIPHVDFERYFAGQDPEEAEPLDMPVPIKETPSQDPAQILDVANFPFSTPQGPSGWDDWVHPAGMWGDAARQRASFPNQFLWENAFTEPVVTAGPFAYGDEAVRGFRTGWRGDVGEAMFRGTDLETSRLVVDLNTYQEDFTLYDTWDARTDKLTSIKTQMPTTPDGEPSWTAFIKANRELFGNARPSKRAEALGLLQGNLEPGLTQEEMLRRTQFAVNPDLVPLAQAAQAAEIRGDPRYYDAVLNVMIIDHPADVELIGGTRKTYGDIASLNADADAGLMTTAEYDRAVADLVGHLQDSVRPGVGTAEGDFRPLLDLRQAHDFLNAEEFLGTPATKEGKRAARLRQRAIYEQLATADYLQAMREGVMPGVRGSTRAGGVFGAASSGVLGLWPTVANWDTDPYAGRRYAVNVTLSGVGGALQGGTEHLMQHQISRGALATAQSRALAGRAVTPVASATPFARFGGTTTLGGAFSGAINLGGMLIDEHYFGANFSRSDYVAKTARAVTSGSMAAGAGALASGLTTAYLVGGGGAAGCTVAVPLIGTVACGTAGAAAGFLVGIGAYYVGDWLTGETVEDLGRDLMGEQGCTD